MLTKLKAKVQAAIMAQAKTANKIGLTPNKASALGIFFALLSALTYTFGREHLALAVLLLLLSGYFDLLDGALARTYQRATAFGSFLDSTLDRYADSAIYIGIILGGLCSLSWGALALIGSLLVSYARAKAETVGIEMEGVGLAERAERLIILAIASITEIFLARAIETGIILLTVLTNLTVIQRGLHVYRTLKKKERIEC